MTFDLQSLLNALGRTLTDPAAVAREIVQMNWDRGVLWTALALVAVLNVILLALMQLLSPVPDVLEQQGIVISPFTYTVMVVAFLVLFVFTIQGFGQMLRGTGSFQATLTLMLWFQVVSLALEAVQVVLVLISPFLSGLFGMVSLGVLLWCIVNFIDVLHGFQNKGKAIATLLLALVGMAMGAGLILAFVGVGIPGGTI